MPSRLRTVVELLLHIVGATAPFVWLGQLATHAGGLEKMGWIAPAAMLLPMTSAILVQKLVARGKVFGKDGLGLRFGRLRWWLFAPVLFASFIVAAMLASFALTPQLLAAPAQIAGNLAHHTQFIPRNIDPQLQMLAAYAITLIAGPVLNLPIFLGEEIGWRGFMNPRLTALFGKPGLILGGAIWALWHLPIILLGHNYPQHPWLGMAVWIPICACLNILLEAVRRAAGSVLPCALAHGTINQLTMLMFTLLVVEKNMIDVLHGPAGLIGLSVLILPAALVYRFVIKEPARG